MAEGAASPGRPHLDRAVSLIGRHDLDGALLAVNEALRADELLLDAWLVAGIVNRRLGRHEAAIRCFSSADSLSTKHGEPLLNIAITYVAMERLDSASSTLEAAVTALSEDAKMDPDDEFVLNDLGVALRRLDWVKKRLGAAKAGDSSLLSRAHECFARATQLNTRYAEAWNNLGLVTLEIKRSYAEPWSEESVREAVECFKKAIACDASLEEPWNNLGEVYEKVGELGEAEHFLNWALWLDPKDACAWSNLGLLYKRMGLRDKAHKSFEAAVGLDPQNAAALNNLGGMLFEEGRLEEARSMLMRAVKADRTLAEAWTSLGAVYGRLGDLDEAASCLKNALSITSERDPSAWNDLGLVLLRQGRTNDALSCLTKALSLDERSAEFWNNVGELYLSIGLYDKAREHFDRACVLDGRAPGHWRNAARVCQALGLGEEARMHEDHAKRLEQERAPPR